MKDQKAFQAAPNQKGAAFFFDRFLFSILPTLALVFILVFPFSSCSGAYPRIHDIRYKVVLLQGANEAPPQESLSLALDVTDEDGIEDLEAVALVQDAEELYWKIQRDQWEWKPFGGGKWLVCSGLLSRPGKPFPRGEYRVMVTDMAGYQAERAFALRAESSKIIFPSIEKKDGKLVLKRGSGPTLLVFTSSTGAILGSFPLKEGENSLEQILTSPTIRTQAKEFFLYSKEGEGPILVKGPYDGSKFLFSREETE